MATKVALYLRVSTTSDKHGQTKANQLPVPFYVVWEMAGFKDYFDFVETGGD